jgi:hypothetical protein
MEFPQFGTSLNFRLCKIRASAFAATNDQSLVRSKTHIFATRFFKTNSLTRAELTSVIDVLGRTGAFIVMDNQSAIFEPFVPFSNILHFHYAVIMDASQLTVKHFSPTRFIHTVSLQ